MIAIKIKKLHNDAIVPTRKNPNDAGIDLCSLTDALIPYGRTIKVRTGLAIELPKGHFGLVQERSSFGMIGLKIMGGIIDEGYRGEIFLLLTNVGEVNGIELKAGHRVANLICIPVSYPVVEIVDNLTDSTRGYNGLGSSGTA